jgi:hypothetical protein
MIKIEKIDVFGWEAAIRGMRNPMNSWDKSDSEFGNYEWDRGYFKLGPNDLKLMKSLVKAGTDHRKFLRMINVTMDVTAPLYWWKEFDTYKVGTVANGCSTMHKIHAKEFTLEDFSCEHLMDTPIYVYYGLDAAEDRIFPNNVLNETIKALNVCRKRFLETKDKKYWWQMIQLLPTSYNQKRTVQLNYEVLMNMYKSRKNHKLDEWIDFCEKIKKLPYLEEFINEQ